MCDCKRYDVLIFFFFKQKTAYEMRISDWSSDVCSSDLIDGILRGADLPADAVVAFRTEAAPGGKRVAIISIVSDTPIPAGNRWLLSLDATVPDNAPYGSSEILTVIRSEEHTSELQSLMRISYAVFCLKKKNKTHPTIIA